MPTFRYEKMFKDLSPKTFEANDLIELAKSMLRPKNTPGNKFIPAGYTYLGQFITHDIIFDSKSKRNEMSHRPFEVNSQTNETRTREINLDEIENLRNPVFNLEAIYGKGALIDTDNPALMKLDETFPESSSLFPNAKKIFNSDLPREANRAKARIADPRNDENLALAQTQVAFMKFHNAIARRRGDTNSPEAFSKTREITIRHYQYIILNDFLPRIVQSKDLINEIIAEVKAGTNKFYHPTPDNMFIPIEFSIGAYRTMHSLIKDAYNWNPAQLNQNASLFRLMRLTGPGEGLDADKKKLRSVWLLNWRWFYDIDDSKNIEQFNFAEPLTTKMSSQIGNLIPKLATTLANNLPALDLFRGNTFKLPTGQAVAEIFESEVGAQKLDVDEIEATLEDLPSQQRELFKTETPLLYYLLVEAEKREGGKSLGAIGSRIVTEVFVKLIYESPFSILKEDLVADEDFLPNDPEVFDALNMSHKESFGMPEVLKFIAKYEDADFINPIG